MILQIEVDLKDVFTKQDLFDRFNQVFGFPDYFGNNWNAWYDVLHALDSDSQLIREMKPQPEGIHLILLNFDLFEEKFEEKELDSFLFFLAHLCLYKKYRYDNMSFTFEYRYSDWYNGYSNPD